MVYLDIFNKTGDFVSHEGITGVIEKVLAEQGIKEAVELAVLIVGEARMRELHRKHLATAEVTDVLSFPLEEEVFPDGVRRLGDIVVCYPVAVKQAGENGRGVQQEVEWLVEHGLRHLLGEHHE
jgi:probable rRNA maturation factor